MQADSEYLLSIAVKIGSLSTLLVGIAVLGFGCSGADESKVSGGTGANNGQGAASSGGDGSGGFTLGGSSSGANSSGGSSSASGGSAGFEECAGDDTAATGLPLDMFVVLDHTGSMGNDCPLDLASPPQGNASKWCYATHALAQYFASDAARGHRAALQFMTVEARDALCGGGPDNAQAVAAVPLSDLPAAPTHTLITALDTDDPTGGSGTRIEPALHGIAAFTAANRTEGREMIGILITDGDPTDCEDNVDNLAGMVADHLAATGIRTFFIGMTGATLDNLEPMAEAGGAPEHSEYCDGPATCHYWSVGDGDPVAFVDALGQIQEAAVLPCVYTIPDPPAGQALNKDLVNVTFTDTAGAQSTLVRFGSAGECDPTQPGWYYDDPLDPSTINLCPTTCEMVTVAASGASVALSYGCASRPPTVK